MRMELATRYPLALFGAYLFVRPELKYNLNTPNWVCRCYAAAEIGAQRATFAAILIAVLEILVNLDSRLKFSTVTSAVPRQNAIRAQEGHVSGAQRRY